MEKLYYIASDYPTLSHTELVRKACENGVKLIQLRIKDLPENEIVKIASECLDICNNYSAKLIINDYIDVCLKINAHGVHLGQNDVTVLKARQKLGSNSIIGGTANTLEQIEKLVNEGVNYIGLGPYKFTETKKNLSPTLGIAGYENILNTLQKRNITTPIYAIGGINLPDIKNLLNTGIHGVAVSSLISNNFENISKIKNLIHE